MHGNNINVTASLQGITMIPVTLITKTMNNQAVQ